jgi:hypothetical protein
MKELDHEALHAIMIYFYMKKHIPGNQQKTV